MRVADTIIDKLTAAFAPESVRVEDESSRHEGHAGHQPGGQTHFRIYIVSEAFGGKSRLDRHRMINDVLSAEIKAGVHALAIHASAPGEGV
jgi:BolA family transcriptional regulator, general stress-responsive regulator